MYTFLFEDSPNTPSSKLLKCSYNGDSIYFSDGNLLIRTEIDKLLNKGKRNIIVFLDVNPNNINTVKLYNFLSKLKNTDVRWENVIIIPIICIEFYIAEVCKKYGYFNSEQLKRPTIEYLVGNFDWDKMPKFVKNKSLEKIYKRVFEYEGGCQECLDNRDGFGIFFTRDCDCKGCNLSKSSLELKAEQLYSNLPVFEIIDEKHKNLLNAYSIGYKETSLKDLHRKVQEFYNDVCTKLGKKDILITTIR